MRALTNDSVGFLSKYGLFYTISHILRILGPVQWFWAAKSGKKSKFPLKNLPHHIEHID